MMCWQYPQKDNTEAFLSQLLQHTLDLQSKEYHSHLYFLLTNVLPNDVTVWHKQLMQQLQNEIKNLQNEVYGANN